METLPVELLLDARLPIAAVVVFAAGVMRGFSGFGSAMLIVPVFSYLYSPQQAVGVMMGLAIVASLQLVPGAVRSARWGQVLPITAAALLLVPVGTWVLVSIDPALMRRGISALVLALALVLLSGWRWRRQPGLPGAFLAGGLSGLINGAAGVGGPPVILYLLAGPNPAAVNRANLITYYAFLNVITLASLYFSDVLTRATVLRVAVLTPVFAVSLWVGTRLFHRASDAGYRRIALLVLVGVALFGLFAR